MIDSLVSAGPPLTGLQNLRENRKTPEKAGSGVFEGILADQSSDPPPRERVTRSDSKDLKEVKPKDQPEKAEEKAPVVRSEAPKKKDGQTREQAIEQFMDSFESELGIPATRLVAAIANLSETEKKAAPEVTAEKVVTGLGLSSDQEQKAQALYTGLLQNLQAAEGQQVMPAITARQDQSFFMQRSQTQALAGAQKNVQSQTSIDNVVKSFWQKEPESLETKLFKQQAETSLVEPQLQSQSQSQLLGLQDLASQNGQQELLVPEELRVRIENPTLQGQDQLSKQGTQSLESANSEMSPELLASLGVAAQGKLAQAGKAKAIPISEMNPHALAAMITKKDRIDGIKNPAADPLKASGLEVLSEGESATALGALGIQQALDLESAGQNNQQGANTAPEQELVKLKDPSELSALSDGVDLGLPQRFDSKLLEALGISLPAAIPMPSESESQVNTQHILNQAKALMAKGGGEVKVQMTPDGMGSVHLKVMMQEGKMQIQMQADNKQTKSALESSLADLKTSLAAQKVSVDNIKVDVVNATSNETAANNQFLDQHNQRETRQFWNQFNEHFGNQSKRNSFFESPSGRGYKAKDPKALEPVQVSSTQKPKMASGKGSGLNLVA